jgi:hypothetical protein
VSRFPGLREQRLRREQQLELRERHQPKLDGELELGERQHRQQLERQQLRLFGKLDLPLGLLQHLCLDVRSLHDRRPVRLGQLLRGRQVLAPERQRQPLHGERRLHLGRLLGWILHLLSERRVLQRGLLLQHRDLRRPGHDGVDLPRR